MKWNLRPTGNAKLGPGAWTVTLSSDTCPSTCQLLQSGGCYAKLGPIALAWRKVDEGTMKAGTSGTGWPALIDAIEVDLPRSVRLLRIGDAGDPGLIDLESAMRLGALADSRPSLRIIAYSHRPIDPVLRVILAPVVIVQSLDPGDPTPRTGSAARVVAPEVWAAGPTMDRDGRTWRRCPAEYSRATCASCGWCSRPDQSIAFTAHGSRKRAVAEAVR